MHKTRLVEEILIELNQSGITLSVAGDKLRLHGDTKQLSKQLRDKVVRNKPDLMAYLSRLKETHLQQAEDIIPKQERESHIPLSFAQQRLWFLDQLEPESAFYNMSTIIRLTGHLDVDSLEQSFTYLIARHESLRTTFDTVSDSMSDSGPNSEAHADGDGRPIQVIHPPSLFRLSVVPVASEEEALQRVQMEATTPFNLSQGPLLRAQLLQLSATDHFLLLIMHHIVSDGWSMGVFVEELTHAYEAYVQGNNPTLPELPIQYADFAVWQRDYLRNDPNSVLEQQLAYWRKQLTGAPALLELPTDRPRPPVQSYRGSYYTFELGSDLTTKLNRLALRHDATLFMVLLAAFNVLLARYSRQDDILVGSPIANRTRSEIEGLIGIFVNTLVLRTQLAENPSFPLLLEQVRQTTLDAYAHQDLPFERLVDALDLERSLSYEPLFQVMMVLQNTNQNELTLPNLTATVVPPEFSFAPYDLILNLLERDTGKDTGKDAGKEAGLQGLFEYATDLFDESTIARMADHFIVLLEGIVSEPERPVLQLPMLTDTEYHQIVHECNETAHKISEDLGTPQTIYALFEQHAERTPDAIALVMTLDGETGRWEDDAASSTVNLTYRELNERANQLAHHLIELGMQVNTFVAIAMERSVQMIISLLAVFKAGGCYVPIDPTYPIARVRYMLADSAAPILITQSHLALAQEAETHLKHVITVDTIQTQLALQPTENPQTQISPKDLAYILYTSGTTGQPKGVMVTHEVFAAHIIILIQKYQITSTDGVLQFFSISFDAGMEQIFLGLCSGARLIVRGKQIWLPEELSHQITTNRITILDLPALYCQQLIKYWVTEADDVISDSLRLLTVGGDKSEPETVKLWQQLPTDHIQFLNAYGPTEAIVTTTTFDLSNYPTQTTSSLLNPLPIGQPIPGRAVYILDHFMQPTPLGVAGELYIGGALLAQGYLNRPDLTAERFIDHPQFARLYKTGDLCRWILRPDNSPTIEYLGRTDYQVKIRGFRVELGEIESVLVAQDGVREAVVLAREDRVGDKRLVAYVVGDAQIDTIDTIDTGALGQSLAKHLPAYMVPSIFVQLDAIPQTPHGKIDRRALPTPDYADSQSPFVAPRNELEQQLAAIWRDLLQIDQVGVYDNFFALGGHSLLATQVISRVRAKLNLDVPLKSLFEASQLGDFAQAICHATSHIQASRLIPIQPRPSGTRREQPLPLSFAQKRLWFLDQLEPDSAFYNIPMMIRLTGTLDVHALELSFRYLIARHESLRTVFNKASGEEGEDNPIQVIQPTTLAASFVLPVMPVACEEEAYQRAQVEITTPFNLSEGPLMRVQLIQIAEADPSTLRPFSRVRALQAQGGAGSGHRHLLLLTMHHIISDGWSMDILIAELSHAYRAYTQGNQPTLPDLPIQYADFALWQRDYLDHQSADSVLDQQLTYWRKQLTGAPALLDLPTDRARPPVHSYRGAHYTFSLGADLTAELKQLAQTQNATLFMVLQAAFNVLLARYSGQTDILVGSPIANRTRAEIEGLIGFFVNTLVLRTRVQENPSFTSLLAQIRQTTLDAYAHQDLPFEQLVDAMGLERTLSYSPLFQVVLVLENDQMSELTLPNLTATVQPTNYPFAKFDLTLNLLDKDAGLLGIFEYATDLFDEATIVRMANHFTVLLKSIVVQPEQPVYQLPMLTDAEYHQIVREWNGATHEIDKDFGEPQTIHALFEQHAECTPDAIAVVFEREQLTYQELNQRANQLAHHLIELGVQADTFVAVAMERSVEMVVSLLAVLKAGGAYVPIDPTYPEERIRTMLADSAAPILLTQSHLTCANKRAQDTQHVIAVDVLGSELACQPTVNPKTPTSAKDLAYVIYTSGSTGEPKGVLIEHGGAFNVAMAQSRVLPTLTTNSRVLQLATLSFDGATFEIMMALMHGGTLVLSPANHERMGAPLAELLRRQRITHCLVVPSVLQTLPTVDLPDLKVLITAGEACPPALVNQWGAGRLFYNFYGPTESPIWTTYASLSPNQPVHIGQPIPNRHVYILDEHDEIVPIGIAGELTIGGAQLARGYLNRPDLTAEKFIDHPKFGRLYKTGDLCRWLPPVEGTPGTPKIEFLGRTDFQVKIRGFRIELGEIENVLLAQAGVHEAVVLVHEDGSMAGSMANKRLVAYVVGDVEVGVLRQHLAQRLPDYMVPSALVMLDAMPLAPNGKLDRHALPSPDAIPSSQPFVPPATATEEALAHIWATVLDRQQIGRHDNFFELGGHSLLAIQLISRISRRLNVNLSVKSLFLCPTIVEQAEWIQTHQSARPVSSTINQRPTVKPPPITLDSPYLQIERSPLFAQVADGTVEPVDSVAFGYLLDSTLETFEGDNEKMMSAMFGPYHVHFDEIMTTAWGRIGIFVLPCLNSQLYDDKHRLVQGISQALQTAQKIGAKAVSLTGLLPSATDYGKALLPTISHQPAVSTGHGTTSSAVILNIQRILAESGRRLETERVAFIGLGSIGLTTLRLMLHSLPHPEMIMLCDLYEKMDFLKQVRVSLVNEFDFQGEIQITPATAELPAEIYTGTLIVGATNVPDVLDIAQVQPGTLLVDDSGPHCFSVPAAIERLEKHADLLFTEGGVLQSPKPIHSALYHPPELDKKISLAEYIGAFDPNTITGCVLSSLLSARFGLPATLGMVDVTQAKEHYDLLVELGFQGSPLHCEAYVLPRGSIETFRNRYS